MRLSEAAEGALVISGVDGQGELRVRAELDATPVDWTTVDLGGAVTSRKLRPHAVTRSAARSSLTRR